MPHTHKKKTNREVLPKVIIDQAISEVKSEKGEGNCSKIWYRKKYTS